MIFGFSSEGDTQKATRCAQAVGVGLLRAYDLLTSNSVASLEADVLYAAQRGVKLLLLYNGDSADMPLGNLVAHIQRVGPAGTLWNTGQPGAGLGVFAPTHIEVGNEYSFSYRGTPSANAVGVANTVQRFYNAVGPTLGANAMKFICEGEDGGDGTSDFMNALFSTVPTIHSMLDGWTAHDYGPTSGNEAGHAGSPGTQYAKLQRLKNRLDARGYTTDKIWITENGMATDNGATLTNNYGWNVSKTYNQAATDLLALARLHGNSLSFSSQIYCFLYYQAFDQQPSGTGQREHYFGIFKSDGTTAKGNLPNSAATLAAEFPQLTGGGGVGPSGIPMPTSDLSGWTLVFNDDFLTDVAEGTWTGCDASTGQCSGLPAAVKAKWFSYPDGWMDTRENTNGDGGFYMPSEVNSIAGSMLRLRMRNEGGTIKVAAPVPRVAGDTNVQLYGRFAVCWRADATPGFKVAWLLWPDSGVWPRDGEIDCPEANLNSTIGAFVHRQGATSGGDQDVYSTSVPFGDGNWHTCVIEWKADNLKLYIDNVLIGHSTSRVPNTPMYWVLQSETSLGGSVPANGAVGNIYIDWAAIWHEGPITIPGGETPGRGGATADGRAPTITRAGAPTRAVGTAQGVGTVVGVYTSLTTYPNPLVNPTAFAVGLKTKSLLVRGGAPAGGFAPSAPGAPVSQTPTPGGAIADGFTTGVVATYPNAGTFPGAVTFPGSAVVVVGVKARTTLVPGGATAAGTAPLVMFPGGATADGRAPVSVRATAAPAGASAVGTAPTERTATPAGGAVSAGASPLARATLTPGGATAAGNVPAERVVAPATPGGAAAAGTAPNSRSALLPGAFIADGFSFPTGPVPHAAVPQGGAVAGGNAPGDLAVATQGGAIAAGTAPAARAEVTAGEAVANGFDFAAPPTEPIAIPGGAIADGTEPLASTALTQGGATADGTAPATQTSATPIPGGADAAGTGPSAQATPPAGSSVAEGSAPGAVAGLTAGGALADGLEPQASETSATPIPGGASAAGTSPSPWVTVAIDGAIGATNQITGATVLITPGGSLAGGYNPHAPFIVSRHFDDDDPPVLAGAFDAGRQRGQT